MNEVELKAAIEQKRAAYGYSLWYIGITDDCKRRRTEHEAEGQKCGLWADWKADSEAIARTVEQYFTDKGMKGASGGGTHPTFVYIF